MKSFPLGIVAFFITSACLAKGYSVARQNKNLPRVDLSDSLIIPISAADLGQFPYFQTLPNFTATDSVTLDHNRTYFFDGKNWLIIDGRVSGQSLNIKNSSAPIAGEFACVESFDKVVAHLGGIKVYTGKLPEQSLKNISGGDPVSLGSKYQMAPSSYEGVVEYVIKTPAKEVWIQLQPHTLVSQFYTLLIVEKNIELVGLNTNRNNPLLEKLEKNQKAIRPIRYGADSTNLVSGSDADLLLLLGVYQKHPEWHLLIECYEASLQNPDYSLTLSSKRASAIRQQLLDLGIKAGAIVVNGMGDVKPLMSNSTERGRLENSRIEISRQ